MWEIFAYHNSEALAGIFNAIAAIMASGTYLSAVAAVAFCGFVAAMVAYMFQPDKLQGWKWIGTVVLIYGVLFVPRVTVAVVDKTGGTPNRIIANVPFGMAALGGLTSSIGNSITELFETAFQTLPGPASLPPELAYQQNGLMFGSRLIQEVRRTSIPDPAVRTDILNFVNNCTAFDIADGTISPTAFSQSADLWTMMALTNPARFSTITTGAGVTTNTCDNVYLSINARLPAQVNNLTARLAGRMNPTLPTLAAQAAIINQVPQAFIRGQITAAASTAADIIRQNALINAINDAGELGCQKINDPSCMMMATGRASAVASQNAAWINGAKIAEQALPVVRNVAEAMCYAVFPLVVLLLFLSSGRTTMMIISGYAVALISIQLWPPLFAILNYMATLYAQIDQAAAAELGGGVKALSLQTASPIYSNAVSAQAVVSYLIIGIPMLAYSLANRLANFGSAVMGGLQGLSSSSMSGSATAAAAVGNSNLGNVTMDQRNITPTTSNPWVTREQDDFGNWRTSDNHGRTAVELLQNKGITSQMVTAQVTQSDVEAASKTATSAASDVASSSMTMGATLADTFTRIRQRVSRSTGSSGQGVAANEEIVRAMEHLNSEAKRIGSATHVGEDQAAAILLKFAGMPQAFGIGGGAAVEKRYGVKLSQDESKVLEAASSDTHRAVSSFADRATRDQSFLNALSSEGQSGVGLASALTAARSKVDSSEHRFVEASAYAEELRRTRQIGLNASRDVLSDPANSGALLEAERLAARYKDNPQALAVQLSSLLGNLSQAPAKFSDGSAVPTTFGDPRADHDVRKGDPALNPDLPGQKKANDSAAATRPLPAPPAAPTAGPIGLPPMPQQPKPLSSTPPELGTVRQTVPAQSGQQTGPQAQDFDKKHKLERKPSGGVVTRNSMVGRATSMVGEDAEAAASAARESNEAAKVRAANSQLQRDRDATPDIPTMLPRGGRRK